MLVSELLEQSARLWPDRPAVWHDNTWLCYSEVNRRANAVCGHLLSIGVGSGERVAILLENSFDYVAAHFGVLKAGGVDVSLNTELSGAELHQLLSDCEVRVLITSRKYFRQWSVAIVDLPQLTHVVSDFVPAEPIPGAVQLRLFDEIQLGPSRPTCAPARSEHELASLVYTSGSTGRPKGVMLSHRNLTSNAAAVASYLGLRPTDRVLLVLPFHYIYGRSILYSQFLCGGSVVIENRFAFPAVALDTMAELGVTGFAGVPSTFSILLCKSDLRKRVFPRLRFVTQAGGAMAPSLQRDVLAAFAPARLYVMYGTTEAAPRLTYVEPEHLPAKWGSIGRAVPGVEVVVADEQGNIMSVGQHGEIAARGPGIMLGYWKDPEATAAVMRHGYYFTGDLGYRDEDGYIFITGRSRDIIKTAGNRVSSKEVEEATLELPGVIEVAAIGVPDEILGEAICIFVVSNQPTLDAEGVRQHLRRRLPPFKRPKWIEFRDDLPKNQAGKIMKSSLHGDARAVSGSGASQTGGSGAS